MESGSLSVVSCHWNLAVILFMTVRMRDRWKG